MGGAGLWRGGGRRTDEQCSIGAPGGARVVVAEDFQRAPALDFDAADRAAPARPEKYRRPYKLRSSSR